MFRFLQIGFIPNNLLPSITVSHIKHRWLPIRKIRLHVIETNKRLDLTEKEALSIADQFLMHSTYWARIAAEYQYSMTVYNDKVAEEVLDILIANNAFEMEDYRLKNKVCLPRTLRIKTKNGDAPLSLFIPPKINVPHNAEIKKNKQHLIFDQYYALDISKAIYNILGPSVWATSYQHRKLYIDISEKGVYAKFNT